MPRFEVHLPAAPPQRPLAATLRVDSENWLAALKAGLGKLGRPEPMSNILCDIQADGSIHVTDSTAGEVFRIRELAGEAAGPGPIPLARPAPAAEPPPAPAQAGLEAGRLDALAEVFERAAGLQERRTPPEGLAFLLDLAMQQIRCESGSVLISRLGSGELRFAVARGPKAGELMRLGLTVPMGVGIAGFCAQENVALAVSDAERDPRFYRAVSEAVGYKTRSILCAPIAAGGRVHGALEVLNKLGGGSFDGTDLAVLAYLAHSAAEFLERLEA